MIGLHIGWQGKAGDIVSPCWCKVQRTLIIGGALLFSGFTINLQMYMGGRSFYNEHPVTLDVQ